METRAARYVTLALGVWLFASAFVWHHSAIQFTNAWVYGIIAVAAALVSLSVPVIRYVNTAVGVWLIISSFVLPHVSPATVWNHVLVGAAMLFMSLVGPSPSMAGRRELQPTP
jgi:hypothetical protein